MNPNKQNLLCLMMIFVIGAISAYDNTMTWIYRESIFEMEQNPVGSWLLDQGGIPLFITVKSATTILLVVFLVSLLKTKYKYLIFIAFAFQLGMFIYLNMFSMEGGKLVWNFGSRGWESDEYHPFRTFLNFVGKYYNCPFKGQPCPFEHIHFGE